jgi:transposase-like protein
MIRTYLDNIFLSTETGKVTGGEEMGISNRYSTQFKLNVIAELDKNKESQNQIAELLGTTGAHHLKRGSSADENQCR